MSICYFERSGTGFSPGENAAGPWSPDMLHGRLFGGLSVRSLESEFGAPGWRVARLTVDMFRPAGFELVEIESRLVRRGRRICVADAVVTVGGTEVASARAVILAQGDPPPGDIWQEQQWKSPHPTTMPKLEPEDEEKQSSAWDIRVHEGGFRSSDRSRMWTNENGTLLVDEPLSPAVRAALSADLASPASNGSEVGVGYINADYTLAMARYPVGEWIGLETTTHLAADGIALGAVRMYDLDGPFATSTTTALANPFLT